MMKCTANVGSQERKIRIIAGTVIIAVGIFVHSWIAVVIGLIPLLTGTTSWCPLYALMGKSTMEKEDVKEVDKKE